MTAYKTDVDNVAAAYLKNQVNGGINPFHSGWTPQYCNTGYLREFHQDPTESHPSYYLGNTMSGPETKNIMVLLGKYYAWIARGHYGLLTTDQAGTRYQGEGVAYFAFNELPPGSQAHYDAVVADLERANTFQGLNILADHLVQWYVYAWGYINAHKDDIEVDMTICHSSCHSSCHGSRGRR